MSATIRLAAKQDAEQILAIYTPIVRNTSCSFELEPPSLSDMRHRIADTLEWLPWLTCDYADDVVGYAYATPHRVRAAYQWSVEVSVYIHEDYRGKGIARALYTSLCSVLAVQGFYNAFAGITLPNQGAIRLHESAGFEQIAVYRKVAHKLGAWHDVAWWQRTLQDYSDSPKPPEIFKAVKATPAWHEALQAGTSLLKF